MKSKFFLNGKRAAKYFIIVIMALIVVSYFLIPKFNSFINGLFMLFSSMSVEMIIGYIRSFGIYAVIVSFMLMMFQSLIAPLPAFLITFANAAIFGWWQGAILSWTSSMAGAALCFYISKLLGREAVEKITSKYALESVDVFFEKYGRHTIIICRLLPFISFDYVSYAAGLTSMGFIPFFAATGIGQMPATIIYSYVGGMLTGGVEMVVTALLTLFAMSISAVLIKHIFDDKRNQKKEL